ncbi:sentrin-specific protease 7b [Takifugu rubripes]|uniref:sentrin-specific protease 7b n=1 Tax=Takifugu rubripes TaxID=31033 RepID=UPI001145DC9C|nr:sentrin-specific protease 7 [Takifugu rubripes]
MDTPFRIPKKKQPSDSDPAHTLMQSPLSCLQPSTPNVKCGYGEPSNNGKAERRQSGNTFSPLSNKQSTPCKPFFGDVVKTLLGLNNLTRAAPSVNQRAAGSGSQRGSSSACFSNGWRPKRASDRLLSPGVTSELRSPPLKRTDHSGSQLPDKHISVESLDSLAALRDEKHAGSLTLSGSQGPADQMSNRRNSGEQLKQKNLSPSTSTQSSEEDFLSSPRTKSKPCDIICAVSKATPTRKPPSGRARPTTSSDVRDDLREEERQKWRKFREKKVSYRSAVLKVHPRKPRQNPSEPIVLSSEEEDEGEEEGDSSREEVPGTSDPVQDQQASPTVPKCVRSPSFLQLEFTALHAGLMKAEANGTMMITEHGITIRLKGAEEGEVVVVASQLRGYGLWDGSVARDGSLLADCEGPAPSLLFLWVTDAQASLLQMELRAIQTSATASAPPCFLLLLVLEKQLQELETAMLASILDMTEYKKGHCSSSSSSSSSSCQLSSPLKWTDGLLLIHSCPPPLDQHLLRLLGWSAEKPSQVQNSHRSKKISLKSQRQQQQQQLPARLIQYPPPPCRGRITVTKEDLACLDAGEFLNDVIIDFYLKFLVLEGVGSPVSEQSHVFSSFFFKQLSRRKAAGENDAPAVPDRHMRHQRVKTWTRHVDIFTKDFLFVPVNQEAHWFLVVVCFPSLEDVQYEKFHSSTGQFEGAEGKPNVSLRSQQKPECLQQDCRRDTVLKRPCILVMDSLKLSYHENVCRLLRDYLQVEWEVRRGTPRLFTQVNMRSSNCRVPQQDNSSDCGLYLLQYAESFLQNPVVHFELPVRLDNWFPRQQVRQKREEIRSLIMKMHQSQIEKR